ncbi:MAG TPA: glycine oxidase ThiO [Rhizomicrobium sp.]|jgi:glycine oxidase ThiO|nr:glycine oxidase ThiO [Rhizomicrobium sp.]
MKIVIIGAGVAGLAIGLRLAEAGQEVTVLERAQPGGGATWASAGMLAVTAEALDAGPEETEFAKYSNSLWPDFAKKIEVLGGRRIGYSQPGVLILAGDAIALGQLERKATEPRVEILTGDRLRALAPLAVGSVGALWSPLDAIVDNRALGLVLAIALQKAGGRVLTNEAVVRIERRGARASAAHTPYGLHHADAFVLAAGAWSSLLEETVAPIAPVKGQMIFLTPPAGISPPAPVIWGNGIYAVPRGSGLAIGATIEEAGFDTALTDAARESLHRAAAELMPELKQWTVSEQWAGLRPRAPDGLPMLGPTSVEGLWLASGQYRNGILFAPALAENLAGQILGEAKAIPAFDPRRFAS